MIAACCSLGGLSGHQAGRSLLQRLYREEIGGEMPRIRLTARGKPYFENSPWYFSITHTNRHAFCVIASVPVGIDAEELDRPISLALAKRILSPTEQLRFAQAGDQHRAFLALWVLKEATAKCSGLGLTGFPNHTDFSPEDPRVLQWAGCLVAIAAREGDEGVIYRDF